MITPPQLSRNTPHMTQVLLVFSKNIQRGKNLIKILTILTVVIVPFYKNNLSIESAGKAIILN